MTDPLDGMLDDDLDELLDGTTGASPEPEEQQSMPEPATGPGDESERSREDRTAAGKEAVQTEAAEVRIDPSPVNDTEDYDDGHYDVLLNHGEGRAVLVEPGSAYGDDRYQVLGEEPDLEPDEYDEPVGVEPGYPSTLAEAGASVTAGTITAGFMTAEAGLEAFYNGLRGLVGLMD